LGPDRKESDQAMNRIASAPMEADSSVGWHFPLRQVGFREAGQLLTATIAPFRAAPLRLTGLFLLLTILILVLASVQTLGPLLSNVAEALAFTAYTVALDAAARSEPPDLRHLGVVLGFGQDKLILLVVSGLLPFLIAVLSIYGIWGLEDTAQFLAERSREKGHPSPVMELDFRTAEYLVSMPFTFVAPVWALYRWSGSRSMAANLLACMVNWRWVLALTGFQAVTDSLLDWMAGQSEELRLPVLAIAIAVQMLSLSWTLALAQRSFPAR
jgi:hypothetical protein